MSTNIIAILLGILIIIIFIAYRTRWKKKQAAFRQELIEGYGQDSDREDADGAIAAEEPTGNSSVRTDAAGEEDKR